METREYTTSGFIVVWDDGMGLCAPLSWDAHCLGALSCCGDSVAIFPGRKEARKAISISTHYAKLCKAQGLPENTDFTEGKNMLRILPAKPNTEADATARKGLNHE